jgi:hypothetical protein
MTKRKPEPKKNQRTSRKRTRFVVQLEFLLDEEVTPDLFVSRVAEACACYGAIRVGEAVRVPGRDWEIRRMEESKER